MPMQDLPISCSWDGTEHLENDEQLRESSLQCLISTICISHCCYI